MKNKNSSNISKLLVLYSPDDKLLVQPMIELLRGANSSAFSEKDSMKKKRQHTVVITTAVEDCQLMYLVWCSHSAKSPEIREEYEKALALKKDIVPILLDNTPLPPCLSSLSCLDLQDVLGKNEETLSPCLQPLYCWGTEESRRIKEIEEIEKLILNYDHQVQTQRQPTDDEIKNGVNQLLLYLHHLNDAHRVKSQDPPQRIEQQRVKPEVARRPKKEDRSYGDSCFTSGSKIERQRIAVDPEAEVACCNFGSDCFTSRSKIERQRIAGVSGQPPELLEVIRRADDQQWRDTSSPRLPQADTPCYIYADMDNQVIVNHVTTLEVTVSGERIEIQSSSTTQDGIAYIDSNKRLIVQVIAKTNFMIVNDDRVELDPPSPSQIHQFYFDLRPTNLGQGEVWVLVRQGQMPLLTLSLEPKIVKNRAQLRPFSTTNSIPSTSSDVCVEKPLDSSLTKAHAAGTITDFPSPSAPLHELRIIEQCNGNQITYRYDFDSPELDLFDTFVSRPITCERQNYVENLYKNIESRWLSNPDDVEAFTAELRAFGGNLFDELFPSELQSLLWKYHSQFKNIMVISTEPFIPWELVHIKEPGQMHLPKEMRFLGQMGLVRWLYGTPPPQTMKVRKGRVYYVIPHYPDPRYCLPQAEQEFQFLEQTFQAKEVKPKSPIVRQLLESGDFDLLHFAGHGMAEQNNIDNASLLMQGRIEGSRYIFDYLSAVTVKEYSKLKSERDKNRPMVVLNACQIGREGYSFTSVGGFAPAFLNGGAGAFVGPLWSVGDRPARMFTETLYKGLIEGLTLSEATTSAREQAKQAGDATWLAYAVYGHPYLKINLTNI